MTEDLHKKCANMIDFICSLHQNGTNVLRSLLQTEKVKESHIQKFLKQNYETFSQLCSDYFEAKAGVKPVIESRLWDENMINDLLILNKGMHPFYQRQGGQND